VDPKLSLDEVEERKIPYPCRESNPARSSNIITTVIMQLKAGHTPPSKV